MRHEDNQCAAVRALRNAALLALTLSGAILLTFPAQAQTFSVLHNFTGGADGAFPEAGLTIDARGNLYGTANQGGRGTCSPENAGCGVVFKVARAGSGWIFTPIYAFQGDSDGAGPYGRVTFGPDGALYGSTVGGGSVNCLSGCGTVYRLRPSPTACVSALCQWRETVLYRFQGDPNDAYYPTGDVAFDSHGSLYGTTYIGGPGGPGAVYQLTPSGGGWTESLAYSFRGQEDGGNPYGGVVFDNSGNMYVPASAGGPYYDGTVVELSPSGSGWTEHTLYDFQGGSDGGSPFASLMLANGSLFGTTLLGPDNGGTAFQLTPSSGSWSLGTIADLPSGYGPFGTLTADAAGNLYGTTQGGNGDQGTVFKLAPSGGGWTLAVLHHFVGRDGSAPLGVVVDANGKIFGTTSTGGEYDKGVVFEIAP